MSKTAVDSKEHDWFFHDLTEAGDRVLVLDYDGTLAPFSKERDAAVPYPGVRNLLSHITTHCRTRVIVISGRSAEAVVPLLGISPPPEIWGAYGLERLHRNGFYEQQVVAEEALDILARAEVCLDREGLGHLTEVKLAAVAVHWRNLDPTEVLEIRSKVYNILHSLAAEPGLLLAEFDGGVEIRLRSANKGEAVRALLSEVPDNARIAYLGDDASDEDAFRVLNGRGLTVLVRPKPRFTAAQLWVRPPNELTRFLGDWIRATTSDS